jgi:glycosyltransferase involved in cell wall biosynthesis
MKIIYDYSAFVMQARGGVSRVLFELFIHVVHQSNFTCKLFAGFHKNAYLNEAPAEVRKHIIGWKLPDLFVKQRIFMPINRFLFRLYSMLYRPDICHYTYFDTPYVPKKCKVVITIHDLIHELYPEMFGKNDPQHNWKMNAIGRADGIICVSENTRRDLRRFFNLEDKRLKVIYHGNSLKSVVPELINFCEPFIMFVGNRAIDYKNFDVVLRGLSLCKKYRELNLVCFGGGAFTLKELHRIEELGLEGRVVQRSGNDCRLAFYYSAAKALIYPSKYEGFGLPPVEAMSFGCPVIVSNAPPMPEIISEYGLYFNPDDERSLKLCIEKLMDDNVRFDWCKKVRKGAEVYSWNKAANEALIFYQQLLAR